MNGTEPFDVADRFTGDVLRSQRRGYWRYGHPDKKHRPVSQGRAKRVMAVDASASPALGNYVASSQPGCHIAHHTADWVIETSAFEAEAYGMQPGEEEGVPDIIVDPETRSLSAINTGHDTDKSFFISTKHAALDGQGRPMATGLSRDSDGREERVVTLVLVVRPRSVIEACYLDVTEGQACGEEELDLFSDIKSVAPHPSPSAWEPARAYPFPLGGNSSFLCSQGTGGEFTHFYPGTHHAVDLECPQGTPVLAMASGVVKEVRQSNTAGGIHARGLFDWNSVTVLQDDGLLAEYVHILAGSALVEPGDRVAAGQRLCSSGGAGFCPTPHLHLQLQEGESDTAPTVQFAMLDCEGNPYFPVAGKWYGSQGEEAPQQQQQRLGVEGAVVEGSSCGGGCADSSSNPSAGSKTSRSR